MLQGYQDSIINKTPIFYSTNRKIGGVAPSIYLSRIEKKKVEQGDLRDFLAGHWIDMDDCMTDDFEQFIAHRAGKILDAIATGEAEVTPAYGLHAKFVIHTVGPVWQAMPCPIAASLILLWNTSSSMESSTSSPSTRRSLFLSSHFLVANMSHDRRPNATLS